MLPLELDGTSSEILYFTERGSGPPPLLVHGLMVTGEMFDPVIDQFAARRRVIMPDLRGHGRSRELSGPYTVAQLASDLCRLLDHLEIRSAAVLGYSQGGAVAQQLVCDYPQRCERLVLACIYAYNMATLREYLEGHFFPLFIQIFRIKRMAKIVTSIGAKHLGETRAAWLTAMVANQDQTLMLAAWRGAVVFDGRERLAEIRSPTLVISGSADGAVPIHHANMLQSGIPGSELVVVDGTDHALIWTHPFEFVRLTETFLGCLIGPWLLGLQEDVSWCRRGPRAMPSLPLIPVSAHA